MYIKRMPVSKQMNTFPVDIQKYGIFQRAHEHSWWKTKKNKSKNDQEDQELNIP